MKTTLTPNQRVALDVLGYVPEGYVSTGVRCDRWIKRDGEIHQIGTLSVDGRLVCELDLTKYAQGRVY